MCHLIIMERMHRDVETECRPVLLDIGVMYILMEKEIALKSRKNADKSYLLAGKERDVMLVLVVKGIAPKIIRLFVDMKSLLVLVVYYSLACVSVL